MKSWGGGKVTCKQQKSEDVTDRQTDKATEKPPGQ